MTTARKQRTARGSAVPRGKAASAPRKAMDAPTPLARMLRGDGSPRRLATPLELFEVARARWVAGERFDIGKMASELGVSRATVFRWVGSRERLYGEVISSLFASAVERARREARGTGAAYATDVARRLLHFLLSAEPLRVFVHQDPEYALRVLMSKGSPVEARCIEILRTFIEEEARAGHIDCPMDPDSLAYVVLRIGEAFLYRDVITGGAPDVDKAVTAIGILFGARPAPKP